MLRKSLDDAPDHLDGWIVRLCDAEDHLKYVRILIAERAQILEEFDFQSRDGFEYCYTCASVC